MAREKHVVIEGPQAAQVVHEHPTKKAAMEHGKRLRAEGKIAFVYSERSARQFGLDPRKKKASNVVDLGAHRERQQEAAMAAKKSGGFSAGVSHHEVTSRARELEHKGKHKQAAALYRQAGREAEAKMNDAMHAKKSAAAKDRRQGSGARVAELAKETSRAKDKAAEAHEAAKRNHGDARGRALHDASHVAHTRYAENQQGHLQTERRKMQKGAGGEFKRGPVKKAGMQAHSIQVGKHGGAFYLGDHGKKIYVKK